MVTLKDIARKAGVSAKTVSLVLNGRQKGLRVDAIERAEKIRRIAEELGYRPNVAAKATVKGRCMAHGLMVPNTSAAFLPNGLLQELAKALGAHGVHLKVGEIEVDLDAGMPPKLLRELAVDAIAIEATHSLPQSFYNTISRHQIPAIYINAKREFDCIYPNDHKAGRMAAMEMVKLGHTRLGYVCFLDKDALKRPHYSVNERRNGVLEALGTVNGELVLQTQDTAVPPQEMVPFMIEALRRPDRPTGIVTYSTRELIATMHAAAIAGFSVPGDLSVTTINWGELEAWPIQATSVCFWGGNVGRELAGMLEQKFAQPDVPILSVESSCWIRFAGQTVAPPA